MTKSAKIQGSSTKPRVSVFRSNNSISVQFVDDTKGITLIAGSTKDIDGKAKPVEKALEMGKVVAKLAKSKKIEEAVFDRNGYQYHGQVKAVAEGLREGGIKL